MNVVFEERCDNENEKTATLYFIAPKEMLCGKYPEAEHMEISIECPIEHIEKPDAIHYATVMFSPSRDGSDYDWFEGNLPDDELRKLINLALGK